MLASDEYEGRETGMKGPAPGRRLRRPSSSKNAGLTGPVPNPADPYQQHFNVEQVTWADGTTPESGQAPATSGSWISTASSDSPFAQETTVTAGVCGLRHRAGRLLRLRRAATWPARTC
ncbi:MAG: hypothetical protein WKG07_19230 [Hymenobacter sp.]